MGLVSADRLADLDLDRRLGCRATGLEVTSRTLEVDGIAEPFDGLVLATGARCRTLPDTEGMAGVYTLRTRDDAAAIRDALATGVRRMAVVGAGFIGAEVASTAVQRGVEVTMVEALDTPFGRVLGAEMGAVVADELYGRLVPVVVLAEGLNRLRTGVSCTVSDHTVIAYANNRS